VVVEFSLATGGNGCGNGWVFGASYSLVVVVSVTWWVVEQPTRQNIANPAQPEMTALTGLFIDVYPYDVNRFEFRHFHAYGKSGFTFSRFAAVHACDDGASCLDRKFELENPSA
jgi:hypothetical protein